MQPGKRSRVLGWWYLSIGAGFILLGGNRLLMHDRTWLVALRWLIALGFILLGRFELSRPGSSS
jgi:hypothetical protein